MVRHSVMLSLLFTSALFLSVALATHEDKGCIARLRADVIFVVDSSGSVGQDTYRHYVIGFLKDFAHTVQISDEYVRMSVIVYSSKATMAISANAYSTKKELMGLLDTVPYLSGRTATGEALRYAASSVASTIQSGRERIVIVITDGKSNEGVSVTTGSSLLHSRVNRVIAVGVTDNVNRTELLDIAGGFQNDVYYFDSFQELFKGVKAMTRWACPPLCGLQITTKLDLTKKRATMLSSNRLEHMRLTSRTSSLKEQVSLVQISNEKITIRWSGVKSKIEALKAENMLLLSMGKTVDMRTKFLLKELEELRARFAVERREQYTLTIKIQQQSVEISKQTRSLSSVSVEVNSLKQMIAKLTVEHNQLKMAKVMYEQRSEQLIVRMRSLRMAIHTLMMEYSSKQIGAKKVTSEFEQRISRLEITLSSLKTDVNKMEIEYTSIQRVFDNINEDVTKCKQLVTEEKIKSRKLVENIQVLEIKIAELEKKLVAATSTVSILKSQMTTKTRTVDGNIDSVSLSIKELTIKLRESKLKLEELRSQRTFTFSRRTSLNRELVKFETEVTRLDMRASELVRQLQVVSNSISITQSTISSVISSQQKCDAIIQNHYGILLFAIKSSSGFNVADVMFGSQYRYGGRYNDMEQYFKNKAMEMWSASRFSKVFFMLYSKGVPVVQLVFNAEASSSSDWFKLENLQASYPWDIVALKEKHRLSLFELQRSGRFSFVVAESAVGCNVKGFLSVSGPGSGCTERSTSMFYTLEPHGLATSDRKYIHTADELRIYTQYFAFDAVRMQPQSSNPVLLEVSGNNGEDDIADIWLGNLASPAQSYGTKTSGWYKNAAVNYWPVGKYSKIEVHVKYGGSVAIFGFNTRGSNSVNWFTKANLVSTSVWSMSNVETATFEMKHSRSAAFWVGDNAFDCSARGFMGFFRKGVCNGVAGGIYFSRHSTSVRYMQRAESIQIIGYL